MVKKLSQKEIYFEYILPLNLIPLFYFKDFEKFKIFIMSLIHWDEKTQKFELEQNVYTTINNLLKNCRDLKSKFDIFEDVNCRKNKSERKYPQFSEVDDEYGIRRFEYFIRGD